MKTHVQSSRWHCTQRSGRSDIFTNFDAIGLRIQTISERDFRFPKSYVLAGVTHFFAKQKSRSIESLVLHSNILREWHFHESRSIWRLYIHVFWSRNFQTAILCPRLSYSLFRKATSRSIELLVLHSKILREWHFHEFRCDWAAYTNDFWTRFSFSKKWCSSRSY